MKMKRLVSLAAFACILVISVGQEALAAEQHHHGDGASAGQQLQLNAGKKWATDAPLRQSMTAVNQAMAKALPLIHKGRFGDADFAGLAATIRQKVAYAIEHCKLEPEADAMLHFVIAELMAGADAMDGKMADSRHDGAVRVLQALRSYGKYFQHPDWKAAKA
ncbi:hypothetical protein [Dechloromonas sp. A34]|uniref:hypothetical protein n=1 Tax=Dechloromonas sp. A34 TaxID=447588 RepID=UPI0022490C1C|nr:hypothetical protein [Dechloromonas sp. A34]